MPRTIAGWLAIGIFASAPVDADVITVQYVDPVSGYEWADLNDTLGFSWNEVASVCPTDGTPCTEGALGGMSVAPWTWASRDEVRDLFVNASSLTAIDLADYEETSTEDASGVDGNSVWAPELQNALGVTFDANSIVLVTSGWTATEVDATAAYIGSLENWFDQNDGIQDVVSLSVWGDKNSPQQQLGVDGGVWLRRQAVPEPSTLLLTCLGVGIVAYRRRRKP